MLAVNPDCRNQFDSIQLFDVIVLLASPVEGELNKHSDFEVISWDRDR